MRNLLWIFLVGFIAPCGANVTIGWSSDFRGVNRQSDGTTPLDESFEFVLGTFVGIVPTLDNLSEWEDAWQPFGTAIYDPDPDIDRFSNSEQLTSNAAPFTTTARAYIWGRNGLEPGSEWILIGKPSWQWPLANPVGPPPFPTTWLVSGATGADVVLGSVDDGIHHMQTAKVVFELNYGRWASMRFSGGEASAPTDDFDNDGRSNFLEYALDSDPKVKDGPFEVSLNADLEIEIARGIGRQVNWVLKNSGDLTGFTEMVDRFEIVVEEPDRLVYRILPPQEGRQFYQLEAIAN